MYDYVSIGFFTITICHHATQHALGQGQGDLQEWADRNPMKVSKCKCQALPLGRAGSLQWDRLRTEGLGSSSVGKALGWYWAAS